MKKFVKKRVHELMLVALDIARLQWGLSEDVLDFVLGNEKRFHLIEQYKILFEGLFPNADFSEKHLYNYAYDQAVAFIEQSNIASESIYMTKESLDAYYAEQNKELDDARSTISHDGTVTSAASHHEAVDLSVDTPSGSSDDKGESALVDNQSSDVWLDELVFASAFKEACSRRREIDPLDIKTRHPFFSQLRPLPFRPSTLLEAVCKKRIKSVKAMLECGAFDHSVDSLGNTALHIACSRNLIDMINLLLQHQVNTTMVNKQGRTAMQEAAVRHHISIVSLLLQHELKIQGTYELSEDLFQMMCDNAAYCHHPAQVMPFLLMLNQQGVLTPENTRDLSKIIDQHSSRIDCVRSLNALHKRELLQTYLKKYKHTDPTQVLHHAIIARDALFVDKLIQAGFSIELQNQHHQTPLHTSIKSGNINTTILLLSAGSNIMACDNHGFTALHMASQRGDFEAVQAILHCIKPDDINIYMNNRTRDNKTALMIAKDYRRNQIVELLEDYTSFQARLERINYTGDIPEKMKCPISLRIMNYPLTLSTGHTYDRRELGRWFKTTQVPTCPKSRSRVSPNELTNLPTYLLRDWIEEFVTVKEQEHRAHNIVCEEETSAGASASASIRGL